jgi:hypothetical protein
MSKINVTIPANLATKPRPALTKPAQIAPTAAVFFLVFARDAVELLLTDLKSITCSMVLHSITHPMKRCHCGISHN